ncbi:MAG TPA: class I SAM-dependent methyltransferase [Beijerinckiaceae bacterium]|jgi:SAM-dependent methyltransferase|nr:class I SAM-dependent methyltransferase [Beijerinckiaceae bacterium]
MSLKLDLEDVVRSLAEPATDDVWGATNDVLALLPGHDFSTLDRHSPGLGRGWDWVPYLRLSAIRIAQAAALLRQRGALSGRLLDFGSYFGNFAFFARRHGFDTLAFDSYAAYGSAFESVTRLMAERGIRVLDPVDVGSDLARLPAESVDVVLCMGVIEHIPHTPRLVLEAISRVLRPGGTLILETPNLAYTYTRRRLMEGRPIGTPIELQFETEIPFEGHHREYTLDEVTWMLRRIGQVDIDAVYYNYSIFGLPEIAGDDLERHAEMEHDPSRRELIITASRKAV